MLQQQQEQQRKAQQPPPPPVTAQVVRAEVVTAEVADGNEGPSRLSKIGQQVKRDINTSEFAQRADRLGDATEQADERMEEHLHAKFDHKLGSIGAPTSTTTGSETPADSPSHAVPEHPLMKLLSQPQNIRNAVILSEIFKRPE
jgi:hypothetical protein